MSRRVSILVYGDCPELQRCSIDFQSTPIEEAIADPSGPGKELDVEMAILEITPGDPMPERYISHLAQYSPDCSTLVFVQPEHTGLLKEMIHVGVDHYLVRSGDLETMSALLVHTIEKNMERHFIRRRLHENDRRFWTLFNHCPQGLSILGLDGRCEHANPALCDMLDYHLDELRTRYLRDLLSDDDRPIWKRLRRELMREQQDFARLELSFLKRGGDPCYTEASAVLLRAHDGRPSHLLVMIEDQTEKRRIQDNLEHADRMQALGRLAGEVAHDFNNLLTIINSHCYILREHDPEEHREHWSIDRIQNTADRGSKLTRQLMALGRHRKSEDNVVDPNHLLKQMRVILESLFGKGIRIHLALDDDLRPIVIDPNQLEQIIMNLAINAKDAMDSGGNFEVRTYHLEVDIPSSAMPAELPRGQYTVLEISDTGQGMSPEIQQQIFEPFFTTKDVGDGTGLGLATVANVIHQHDGHITVDSEEGRGTTLKLYFPSSRQDSDTPPKLRRARQGTPMTGNETILLVEDEKELRIPIRDLLLSKGYQVIDASCGEEALKISDTFDGPIHLLLTDVIMPGIDGIRLANRISDARPETSVLLMSGYTADTLTRDDQHARERPLLQKPFGMDMLSRTIRNILNTRPGPT